MAYLLNKSCSWRSLLPSASGHEKAHLFKHRLGRTDALCILLGNYGVRRGIVYYRVYFAIRHTNFIICIDLAVCGRADGYVEAENNRFHVSMNLLIERSFPMNVSILR